MASGPALVTKWPTSLFAVAGIDAEGEAFRLAELEHARQQRRVVEVENDAALQPLPDVVVGEEIAAEHDVFAAQAEGLGEEDLIDAGGVDAGAFLAQDVGDGQVVAALDGVEETEVGVVLAEGRQGTTEVGPDAVFLVHIGRRAVGLGNRPGGHAVKRDAVICDVHGRTLP